MQTPAATLSARHLMALAAGGPNLLTKANIWYVIRENTLRLLLRSVSHRSHDRERALNVYRLTYKITKCNTMSAWSGT